MKETEGQQKVGESRRKSRKEVGMVRAFDEKREDYVGRRVRGIEVKGRRGRTKIRWLDGAIGDLRESELSGGGDV